MRPIGPNRVIIIVGLIVVAAIIVTGLLGSLLKGDRAAFDSKLLSLLIAVGALVVLSPLVWLAIRFAFHLPRSAICRILRTKFPLGDIGRISAVLDSGGLDFGEEPYSPPVGFLVFDSAGLSVWSGQLEGGVLFEENWSLVTWLDADSQLGEDVIGMSLAGRTLVVSLEIREGGSWVPITPQWAADMRTSYFG